MRIRTLLWRLILASIAWKNRSYAEHAHLMLRDLWSQATVEAGGHRYLLAGDSLCQRNVMPDQPSCYAPLRVSHLR